MSGSDLSARKTELKRPVKIDVINGWRGFAVLAVLAVHSFARMPPEQLGWLTYVLKSGWVGVNMFFIASGFVLYLPYALKERTIWCLRDAFLFLVHRANRLVPLCFIGSFVAFVMFDPPPVTEHHFWFMVANFPLATFSWIAGYNVFNGNGALWSISVEFVLSAIFPLLVVAVYRFRLINVFAVIFAMWIAHRMLLSHPAHDPIPIILNKFGLSWFGMFAGDVVGISLIEFLIGMAFAELYAGRRYAVHFGRWSLILFLLGLGFIVLFFNLFWKTYGAGFDPHFPRSTSDALIIPILHLGLAMLFAGVLWATERSLLYRVFSNWPIQIIGLMCYSLYIWHPPLLTKLGNPLGVTAHVFAPTLAIIFIFAAVSYRYIEFPKRKASELFLLNRLLNNGWLQREMIIKSPSHDKRR